MIILSAAILVLALATRFGLLFDWWQVTSDALRLRFLVVDDRYEGSVVWQTHNSSDGEEKRFRGCGGKMVKIDAALET